MAKIEWSRWVTSERHASRLSGIWQPCHDLCMRALFMGLTIDPRLKPSAIRLLSSGELAYLAIVFGVREIGFFTGAYRARWSAREEKKTKLKDQTKFRSAS